MPPHDASPPRSRRAGLLAAVAALALAPGGRPAVAQMSTFGAHPKQPFPAHIPRPIEISVGFYLIDFARISGREETFELQGYLTASWVDPNLALGSGEHKGERRFRPDDLWTPNYEFTNSDDQVKIQNEAALVVDDNGRITQRLRFAGKFSWPMDLQRFPFDTQTLTVYVEPFEREEKDVKFVVNQNHIGRMSSAFLTDWTIRDVRAEVKTVQYPAFNRTNSRLIFEITISRQSTFYIWRVLMPMTLLVLTSWVVYRFDPTNLQPLISTTIAILLNVIMFNFSIDFTLPKVPYLTFIDTYAVTSFLFMLLGMLLVTHVHVTCMRDGADAARALQRRILRTLPLAYVGAILAEAVIFLA
jgi:hypothetical protein